jgi:hypothetical protein
MVKVVRYALPLLVACGEPEPEPARRTVFDFESESHWRVEEGDLSAAPSQRRAGIHRQGRSFIGTGETQKGFDIELEGRMRSPVFTVDHDYLVFRAGAYGKGKRCSVQLHAVATNARLQRVVVANTPRMQTHIWDVRDQLDTKVYLRLLDRAGKFPCAIHIDDVRLVDG